MHWLIVILMMVDKISKSEVIIVQFVLTLLGQILARDVLASPKLFLVDAFAIDTAASRRDVGQKTTSSCCRHLCCFCCDRHQLLKVQLARILVCS